MTTTAPATLANALAEHRVMWAEASQGRCICGSRWTEPEERDNHLASVLTAPGGWLDSLAGDEAVAAAVAERQWIAEQAGVGEFALEWANISASLRAFCIGQAQEVLTALAAALRSNP